LLHLVGLSLLLYLTDDARSNKNQVNKSLLSVCFGRETPPPSVGHGLLIHEVFEITLRHITVGRTHLDEWSARRRDLL